MRTIIIDDEKQVREGLRLLLKSNKDVSIVGDASSVREAKSLIERLKPSLVLLDIQLKDKTGFDLLDTLDYLNFKVIFITAHNSYAIRAFKYNAFDYILKPIDPEELQDAILRLKHQNVVTKEHLQHCSQNPHLENILIKTSRQIYRLSLNDIVRCQADQGYTHFYMTDDTHILSSKTLKEYNTILPQEQFIRVHQSHLVNIKHIVSYDKKGVLTLAGNKKIPVSVRKRTMLVNLLDNLR